MSAPNVVGPAEKPQGPDLMEVYKTIFDTWRSQVGSYWQRSNYFAAFETAAIAGCWHLAGSSHLLEAGAGAGLCLLGIWLTGVWYQSNKKTHAYVRHWWDAIRKTEEQLGLAPSDFAQQLELAQELGRQGKSGGQYRDLIQQVPKIFLVAWIALFVIATVRIACLLGYQSWFCRY